MPKTLYLPRENPGSSGIDITWTPTTQRLRIGGWYDSIVGIESTEMNLREFFAELGVTEAHCRRAFRTEARKNARDQGEWHEMGL